MLGTWSVSFVSAQGEELSFSGRRPAFGVTEVVGVEGWCGERLRWDLVWCGSGGADLESPSVGADDGDAADAGRWPGCLGGFVIAHATSVGLRP